jgi:histidinol-phosphate/aromatic aminotransferase/cobyric acid decarboxylase-like protein
MKYPHHLHRKKNVIIVGTLSKFFAGAFLRVGYISAPSDIMRDMYQYKTSYEITGPGIKYLDFVAHNIPAFGRSKIRVDNGKNFIECILNHSMKTYGNFALFPHEDRLLEILKAAVVKECEIDGKKFIRVTATDPVTFRKILNGNPPPI